MAPAQKNGISRRTFIKYGVAGTAAALIAPPAFAEALQQATVNGSFVFPRPVYHTLVCIQQRLL